MNKKLNVAIAGYGVVGKRRGEYINKNVNMKLVAVCDIKFSSKDKINNGLTYYSNYKKLLSHDFDVLFVCLTNDVASEVTIEGLKRGLHVFCEKPPGQNIKQISEVIDAENKYKNLKLKYGFNHRYHDSVKRAKKIIDGGKLGKIIDLNAIYGKSKVVTATGPNAGWRSERKIAGGGILLDQGIHMVDLIRYFSGDFKEVQSFISNKYWQYDVEDNAYAILRSKNGIIAMLQSSATQWKHDFRLSITLEKGSIILKGILSSTKSYGDETLTVSYKENDESMDPKEEITKFNTDPSWEEEINEFSDAIINNKPIVSGNSQEAFKTMELVFRIYYADPEWRKKFKIKLT